MRSATVKRSTAETEISLTLTLDGTGKSEIDSGCPFLDHMLTLFSRHSRFDLTLTCRGDTEVDDHHSTEDIGICLGLALKEALGEKRGIARYGQSLLPMDESLILSAVDLSGRSTLGYAVQIPSAKVGSFDTELCEEFFLAFVRKAELTLHIRQLSGTNSHHILEGIYKSVARSLREAVSLDEGMKGEIPSSKGVL